MSNRSRTRNRGTRAVCKETILDLADVTGAATLSLLGNGVGHLGQGSGESSISRHDREGVSRSLDDQL